MDVIRAGLTDLAPLKVLRALQHLDASDNQIASFDSMAVMLRGMWAIKECNLQGNPVCSTPRWFEKTIVLSDSLETLNGKVVVASQRNFLRTLTLRRSKNHYRGLSVGGFRAGGEALSVSSSIGSSEAAEEVGAATASAAEGSALLPPVLDRSETVRPAGCAGSAGDGEAAATPASTRTVAGVGEPSSAASDAGAGADVSGGLGGPEGLAIAGRPALYARSAPRPLDER